MQESDSTDTTKLKLLNYEIGEMTVDGQNGATYTLLDCDKLVAGSNAVRFRLYDNDSKNKNDYAFAKYSMNYDVELAIPVVDRYNPTGTDPSNPGGTPDPSRDEGGTPGVISGTDGATVQGHAIKVAEAHGYADIDFSFTGGDNFDNNYFQYTYDREKCYLTSKRNDCSTKIQVNLTRFRTGEQASCMTTFYPYEVHLYNGTTNKDYNAGTNLFATGDKQLPYLYVGVLNNYRTYLKNIGSISTAFTLYANNKGAGNQTSHSNLVTKSNDTSGHAYFQTANNSTYQSPTSYAFGVTLTDEYSYIANMRTDGHAGNKDGATFRGIQFSGGDLNATSDTAHEFYTYRFDNLINGITEGETRPFHRTKGGSGTFPTRTGSPVLAPSGLSITNWTNKEGTIAKFYTDEARPSVILNQLYKFNMLNGYAYEGLQVTSRSARESSANMIHIGLATCTSCSIKFEDTNGNGTAARSEVKIDCSTDVTQNTTLANRNESTNKHMGYNATNWESFQNDFKNGTNKPFASYNIVSAHVPGKVYYYENIVNDNLTEEFTGTQTGTQTKTVKYNGLENETYSVNEFFSDKASDNGGNPASVTIKYPRFDGRTKTVSFDVKTIGTAEFRPEPKKTGPDPDNPESGGKILRNYVGRELYIDLKTISEPDLTNSLVTITYNTDTGEDAFQMNRRNDRNEWFTDESPFYIKEVNRSQGTDDWWTTSFAITTTENVDTMDVAVTFNGVKCKITDSNSTTADITTTNTGNYFSYSVNAYNASTTDVNFAWNQEEVSNDGNSTGDSIGFRGSYKTTDIVQLIYNPGTKAAKSNLTSFAGRLAGTGASSFVPYALTNTNGGIGAPAAGTYSSTAKSVNRYDDTSWIQRGTEGDTVVLQSCGTNGYKIIYTAVNAIYAQVKAEDADALERKNGTLASPDMTIWHTAYYFNPGGSTRFTKGDTKQADFDETVQILEVGKKYTLGHTKYTGDGVSTHYAFKWRLIDGESATKTEQIETLTAHAQSLDNESNVISDTTSSWHFNNWGSAFATGKLLSPIYANSNQNTLYVQYPKFANRTGAITYKIEGASFVPFAATLTIGEGHCAVVDLSQVGGKAKKKSVYFTLDTKTTTKDISFDTSLVKSISVKLSSGKTTSTYDTGSFEDKLDKLNKWSNDNGYGIGAFYYKGGKLYFTGRKGGSYKQIDITITSTDGKVINLAFNNMELQSATGVVLKDNDGKYVINQAESINRGDTVFYTLKSNIQGLFNASYRVSISDTFIEMLNTDKYKITTDYRDVGAFSGNFNEQQYIDLMGITGNKGAWKTYIEELTKLKNTNNAKVTLEETAYHVLGQTGTWTTEQKALDFTNPTTGWKMGTSKNSNTVLIQRTLADSTFTESASAGTDAYVSKELKDLNALIVEIPDTSYYPNNERAQFYFNIKDTALTEESETGGFIDQCKSLYNSLSSKSNYSDFDNRAKSGSSEYQSKAGKKTIQIANNLFLQSKSHDALAVTAGGDKLYDSTRSRALNVVQEAAHDDNGKNKADYYNLGGTVPDTVTVKKEKHFHFNSYNQTFGLYNDSESYPTKCLKGASAIIMSKGMFNMYTTRYNNSVLISQPNMETSVNALDFLNTSGLVSAEKSAYTAFSATQLIQNAGNSGKGKVSEDDKWSNHDITLSDVLKTYDGTHTKTATEKSSTTTIKTGGGLDSEKTGDEALTGLSTDTLKQKLSTDYIMYDMTLKKTKYDGKQVAVFQTTKTGVGFKLTLNGTITGSSTYTSTGSAKTGDSYQVASSSISSSNKYSNANAYPNNMPAANNYNYCINADGFSDTGNVDKKDPSKARDAAWVTSAKDGEPDTNCRITFTDGSEQATAFMPYTVASSDKAYNNNLTIWGTDGSNAGTCCMLDIESVVDHLVKNKYTGRTIRYIDTYIDVCYNNNGFRQVRYPVRLVLDQKVE